MQKPVDVDVRDPKTDQRVVATGVGDVGPRGIGAEQANEQRRRVAPGVEASVVADAFLAAQQPELAVCLERQLITEEPIALTRRGIAVQRRVVGPGNPRLGLSRARWVLRSIA